MKTEHCPSCGAPLVDDISDYCNKCGADVRSPASHAHARESLRQLPEKPGPAHPAPAREPPRPSPDTTAPATPAAVIPDADRNVPAQEQYRRPFLKWGLLATGVIILLVLAVAFVPGMIAGTNQSAKNSSPATDDKNPVTALPTRTTAQTTAPVLTTAPLKVTTTAVPKTTVKKTTSPPVVTNTSRNVTPNATSPVPTLAVTNFSQPLSIGDSATDGKGKLTVNSITFKNKMGDPTPSYAIGKKYLIVSITFENLQKNETTEVNVNGMLVKDGGGYTFDQASDVTLENPFAFLGKTVPPQEKRTGNMLYIVPPEATFLKFQYTFEDLDVATFQLT